MRNLNLPFKKDFKSVKPLTKLSFTFTLGLALKMAKETNKGDVKSTCARVKKHASKKMAKAAVNLN